MSSIAYVTDENMIEYFRLCGAREMNFWRLSSRKDFTRFQKGDLLFFYARTPRSRKRGFVGYAHYDSTNRLSLRGMWKKYGRYNGYESEQLLQEAIGRAAKDRKIPEKMNCLYLTDAVFFSNPVYPGEVGLKVSSQLESYMYLDQDDSHVTVRILRAAEQKGIDIWSSSQSFESEDVFRADEIRQQLTEIQSAIPHDRWNAKERSRAVRLSAESGMEIVRGSVCDAFRIQKEQLSIALPFVCQEKNRQAQIRDYFGKVMMYRIQLKKSGLRIPKIIFAILHDEEAPEELLMFIREINEEE
ncbi:MAG: hypothetical protein EOM64_00885 [Erysipelotrichia bacterium]|nr:hypothetical protein [Erysipelotrichia bacterium]